MLQNDFEREACYNCYAIIFCLEIVVFIMGLMRKDLIIAVVCPPIGGSGCVVLNIGRWGGPALKMPERPRKGANFPLKYPAKPKEGQFSVKCPFEGNPWGS